jgi:hypothetical protein
MELWVVGVLVLLLVAVALLRVPGPAGGRSQLTPLGGIAVSLVVAGIVFGEERLLGYGLMGAGVVVAVVDIVRQRRSQPRSR